MSWNPISGMARSTRGLTRAGLGNGDKLQSTTLIEAERVEIVV
jgi:hypothetical protein